MDSEPIYNGCLLIAGTCIEQVVTAEQLSKSLAGRPHQIYDFGEAIIMPGLINLHTHLEHTKLRHLAKQTAFLDWLPGLMQAAAKWSFADRQVSAKAGIDELISSGTTAVVDWSYSGASLIPLAKSGLRAIIGLEIFGVNEAVAEDSWQQWLERYHSLMTNKDVLEAIEQRRLSITVAPHAPYTVCPALWRKAKEWADKNNLLFLTHLAESQAEYNWFHSDDEGMKKFLIAAFSQRNPQFSQDYQNQIAWKSGNQTPVEHLQKRGLLADNLLVAHAIQVNDADIKLLHAHNVALALCPRSNQMLQCGEAPLSKLMIENIRFGLGTDGAASSGDLNLLNEARLVSKRHQTDPASLLGARQILEFLTIKAADCIGMADNIGSLTPGKQADLAVFAMPNDNNNANDTPAINPYEMLLDAQIKLKALFIDGKRV